MVNFIYQLGWATKVLRYLVKYYFVYLCEAVFE